MSVGEASATTLALALHELATNSMKYGAFSAEKGTLDLSCKVHGDVVTMIWAERGGPIVATPAETGFGSKLVNRSMSDQLKGSISCDWAREGVIVTLRMDKDRLAS